MEIPTLWLITRFPVGKYVGVCLTMWGACLCFLALCHNFAGLATVRFILGILEAATLPCMMLINAMWYLREEQPLRTAFWHNTFAGVFGGILSYGIGKIGGAMSTWKVRNSIFLVTASLKTKQYIFLIYGAFTFLFGILFFFAMPDSPSTAWFFNTEEKKLAAIRLAPNQTGIESRKVRKSFTMKQ